MIHLCKMAQCIGFVLSPIGIHWTKEILGLDCGYLCEFTYYAATNFFKLFDNKSMIEYGPLLATWKKEKCILSQPLVYMPTVAQVVNHADCITESARTVSTFMLIRLRY